MDSAGHVVPTCVRQVPRCYDAACVISAYPINSTADLVLPSCEAATYFRSMAWKGVYVLVGAAVAVVLAFVFAGIGIAVSSSHERATEDATPHVALVTMCADG